MTRPDEHFHQVRLAAQKGGVAEVLLPISATLDSRAPASSRSPRISAKCPCHANNCATDRGGASALTHFWASARQAWASTVSPAEMGPPEEEIVAQPPVILLAC